MSKLKLMVSLLLAGMTWTIHAQTQQGYVKTIGRPNQKGIALSGVTVRVRGSHNAVLSNAQGGFEMMMPGKNTTLRYRGQTRERTKNGRDITPVFLMRICFIREMISAICRKPL